MCDLLGPFKLCTCSDDIDYSEPHWFLYNDNQNESELKVVGLIREPSLFEKLEAKNFEYELNNNKDVFDFEYDPNENDHIDFILSEDKVYSFTFRNGKWMQEMSLCAFDEEYHNIKLKGIVKGGSSEFKGI